MTVTTGGGLATHSRGTPGRLAWAETNLAFQILDALHERFELEVLVGGAGRTGHRYTSIAQVTARLSTLASNVIATIR